ncbi:MAG TPA: hypothetical protein VM818_02060 [Vicinamibacterales bacterium]|nr:hypothetical protein [Vicinamibacterales bacterium]
MPDVCAIIHEDGFSNKQMLLAQSLGEYGAASDLVSRFARLFDSGAQWIGSSLTEDRPFWIAAAVCLLIGLWLFRRG